MTTVYDIMEKFFMKQNLKILGIYDWHYEDVYPEEKHEENHEKESKCWCMQNYKWIWQILVTDIKNTDEFYVPNAQLYEYIRNIPEYYPYAPRDFIVEFYGNEKGKTWELEIEDFRKVDNIQKFTDKKVLHKYGLFKIDTDDKYKYKNRKLQNNKQK